MNLRPSKVVSASSSLVAVLALIVVAGCSPSLDGTKGFEPLPIEVADYGLLDLGIADVNDDSLLDVFTSNHSGRQSLLINKGAAKFEDAYSPLKFDQDKAFPGLAVVPHEPAFDRPGLYVYWRGPALVVRAANWQSDRPISGTIELLAPEQASPLKLDQKQGFAVSVHEQSLGSGLTRVKIAFNGARDGHLSFMPYLHASPITVRLDAGPPLDHIYVGPDRVSPRASEFAAPASPAFTIRMRDRHGMAWADFNGDGHTDVFITRGGERGWLGRIPGKFWDELLLAGSSEFKDVGETSGLLKEGCSGYQAAAVDYDGDNLLDLFVSCGRLFEFQPKKLYRQTPDRRFVEVAARAGVDIGPRGSFVWVDADRDGDMDLLWVDRDAFHLYENRSGKFAASRLGANPAQSADVKLTVADFDADGDLDVFAASGGANALLVNLGGTYAVTDSVQWGLPKKSETANWVDYDNDGRTDLHAVPGGLYRQGDTGRFERRALLGVKTGVLTYMRLDEARASWFDADNDGTRDLILALNYAIKDNRWAPWIAKIRGTDKRLGGLPNFWEVQLLRNTDRTNHWLQVQVVGPPGNRAGIGAIVEVNTADAHQLQQVSASEGSHYSLGHYRLYFGLGKHPKPDRVRIIWPDGRTQQIQSEGDQLLVADWRNGRLK